MVEFNRYAKPNLQGLVTDIMIENEHQLKISQQRLKKFRQAYLELQRQHPRPEDFDFYSLGVREHIEQIEQEIEKYQKKLWKLNQTEKDYRKNIT